MSHFGKMVYGVVVFLFFSLEFSSGVIHNLNDSAFELMPALYAMDPYDPCLQDPADPGVYCVADFDLFSEQKSDLMLLIQEYSANTLKHFNRTQIHRGVCVTRTCKQFVEYNTNETLDLNATLEACLNESVWENYKIEARLSKIYNCDKTNETSSLDASDIVVVAIYFIIIVLNTIGTLYDTIFCKKPGEGNPYVRAFSLRRNWAKLVEPGGRGPEPRLQRLKLFYGLRTMTMICVFFSHTALIMSYSYVDNPLYIEKSAEDPLKQLLFNGSLVTHTFFVMSSFLLAYNFQLYAENHNITWVQIPKSILLRWLRLTPVLALILATISTIMRHAGSGPLWQLVVSSEAKACRQYWWAHVLYINNYVYEDNFCMPQTWYLAADTQLFCIGIIICYIARTPRSQKITLVTMLVVALATVAAHTYFQDLDPVVMQAPEKYRDLYETDDTFRLLYIRGHTNLSTYTLGLAGGFLTYYLQLEKKDWTKYRGYRWAYWLLFPLGVLVILSGGIFYNDEDNIPKAVKILYAMLYKPVFQLLVVTLIIGIILKFENIYRGIIEWRGFTWTGRVSYSAFLLHTLFQRGLAGIQRTPLHMTDYYALTVLMATIIMSFVSAAVLWLFVEAPISALTKAVLRPSTRQQNV